MSEKTSKADVDIHLVNADNSALLDRIAPNVFDNPVDAIQLRAFLRDERHILLVATEDDRVIGMASAVEYFHPDKKPQLWINEVGVTPTYRSLGVGRRLVNDLLALAKDRGCVSAWLGTDTGNKAAQACFGSVRQNQEPSTFLLYEWSP